MRYRSAVPVLFVLSFALLPGKAAQAIAPIPLSAFSVCLDFQADQARMTPDTEQGVDALIKAVAGSDGALLNASIDVDWRFQGPDGASIGRERYLRQAHLAHERLDAVTTYLFEHAEPNSKLFQARFVSSTRAFGNAEHAVCASTVRALFQPGTPMPCTSRFCRIQCTSGICETR